MFKPVVTFSLDDIVLLVLYAGVSLSSMENAYYKYSFLSTCFLTWKSEIIIGSHADLCCRFIEHYGECTLKALIFKHLGF